MNKMTPHDAFRHLISRLNLHATLNLDDACMAQNIYSTLKTISDGKPHEVTLNGVEGTLQLSSPMGEDERMLYMFLYGMAIANEKNVNS